MLSQALVHPEQVQQHGKAGLQVREYLEQFAPVDPQRGRAVCSGLDVKQLGAKMGE
jgi:hypothetical protein